MRLGAFRLLTIVFIVLKLTDVINWSWWFVFSPAIVMSVFHLLVLIVIEIRNKY